MVLPASVYQFDLDVVSMLNSAYQAGYNVPMYIFQNKFPEFEEDLREEEVLDAGMVKLIKPKGVDLTYSIYWTGRKFRGGYVSINNRYSGVNRGYPVKENGKTMFAAHLPDIKSKLKRQIEGKKAQWCCVDVILGADGKLYFWKPGRIEEEFSLILSLYGEDPTEENFQKLTDNFTNTDIKTYKPEGFMCSLPYSSEERTQTYLYVHHNAEPTVSAVWKKTYEKMELLKKQCMFQYGMDRYMTRCYGILMRSGKTS